MSILSIDVRVECDECGHDDLFTDYPCWDEHTLAADLREEGWETRGSRHVCPDCAAKGEEEEVET